MLAEDTDDDPSKWVPVAHLGASWTEFPDPGWGLSQAAIVVIWGVNHQKETVCHFSSLKGREREKGREGGRNERRKEKERIGKVRNHYFIDSHVHIK